MQGLSREVGVGKFPVCQSPEGFQIFWAQITEIDVISVFPNVNVNTAFFSLIGLAALLV